MTADARVAVGLVVGVLCLPLTTLLPLYGWPLAIAAGNTPLILLHLLGLGMLAAIIWREDRILAVFVGYVALDALRVPAPVLGRAWQMADAVAFGALLYVWARRIPDRWAARTRAAFGASALLQTAIAGLQLAGFFPWMDGDFRQAKTMVGTLGNDTWLGAYLAICGAVAPWWMLPGIGAGLLLSGHRLGLAAFAVALAVRAMQDRRLSWLSRAWIAGAVVVAALIVAVALIDKTTDSIAARLTVWGQGLGAWWQHGVIFGRGSGMWAWDARQLEVPEYFGQAHNDWLQLLYETGLVGLGLIVAWIVQHRHALLGNPAAWAVAILAVGFFPFHVAQVAAPAIVAIAVWRNA
jgi:hypothetical protein